MDPLPLDILLLIIDLLAGRDDEDVKSLRILSQVCKSMVPLCRKHLFSSLSLHSEFNSERFSGLLLKNPDIARYVRSLHYIVCLLPISDHEMNILDILKKRSSLHTIELWSSGVEWNNLAESMRSSLVSVIQLPTVTSLSIESFKGFPSTALSGCGNLIHLQLGGLNLAPPEVNQVISRSKIPAPLSLTINTKPLYINTDTYGFASLMNSASLHADGPIVDFSRLQKAVFQVDSRGDINQVNELIKATTRLENMEIICE